MNSVHEGKKPFECDICESTFSRKDALYKHVKQTHEEPDLKHQCNICSKAFKNKDYLTRHVSAVHEGKKPFQCNVCSSAFCSKFKLKQHIGGVHEGTKPYQCHLCDAKFYFPSVMNKHIARIHEGKKEDKIKCSICDKLLASRDSLRDHISVVHDGKRPFKCDLCDTSYARQSRLKKHIRTVHEKEKTHLTNYRIIDQKCEHCDNIMKTDLEYVDHLVNEHLTLKLPSFVFKHRNNFKCPDCPDRFAHLKTYYKHRGGLAKVNIERSETSIQLDLPVLCPKKQ
jgi:uncharacterized Zn-finger protein